MNSSDNRNVLLINPWIHDFAAYDLWSKPLGLLTIAGLLRKWELNPLYIDFLDPDHPGMPKAKRKSFQQGAFFRTEIEKPRSLQHVSRKFCRYGIPPELIIEDLQTIPEPSLILITSHMTYWYTGLEETISIIKQVYPNTPILLGGIYASIMPEHARTLNIDDVLTGPAERKLADYVQQKLNLKLSNLDPIEKPLFTPDLSLIRRKRFLPILTTRGCPLSCHYCASNKLFKGHVRRSIDQVAKEIQRAQTLWDIRDIVLYDDAFLFQAEKHAVPLMSVVHEQVSGLRWHTPNGLHAREITKDVALLMKVVGFETIRLGLESSNDQFHKGTGGKTNWDLFSRAVENLHSAGFQTQQIGAYLLAGLPEIPRSALDEDIRMVLAIGAHPKIAEYSPIPGTAFWNSALKATKYPIDEEPLYQNCTLLPCAHESISHEYLSEKRREISEYLESENQVEIGVLKC